MPHAANYTMTIDRGAVWEKVLTILDVNLEPVPLTGATFEGEIRDPNAAVPATAATFTITPWDDLTDGRVVITLPSAQSLLLNPTKFYRYDIFMTFEGRVRRLLEGEIELRANITPQP
jgi:hypothetical protein